MNIPINDAVTVSYVDAVHALSELEHIDWSDAIWNIKKEVDQAIEDLRNAMTTLRPHVNAGCWCGRNC